MATINCLECDEKISRNSAKCPHCGAPRHKSVGCTPAQRTGLFIMGGVAILISVGLFSYFYHELKFTPPLLAFASSVPALTGQWLVSLGASAGIRED